MATIGPYQVVRLLGSCQAGMVHAAVDPRGHRVTVAVLDTALARDPRWRQAFGATGQSLARASRLPVAAVDLGAAAPWIACPVEGGRSAAEVFTAMGQQVQPADDQPAGGQPAGQPDRDIPTTVLPTPAPTPSTVAPSSGVPAQAPSGVPAQAPSSGAAVAAPSSGAPVSPSSGAAGGPPSSGAPVSPSSGVPVSSGAPVSPLSSPGAGPTSAEPWYDQDRPGAGGRQPAARSGSGRWLGLVLLVLLLPITGSAIIVGTAGNAGPQRPTGTATSSAAASPSASQFVTPSPSRPGVEPPRSGSWPQNWPAFAADEKTRTISPVRFGFTFRIPLAWNCGTVRHTADADRITCSDTTAGVVAGGDLLSRKCPLPCDANRRSQLRKAEEAWGLTWTQVGEFTTFAESNQVLDGAHFGLVFVTFWRSTPEGAIDRELVFRMSAPPEQADTVRKVAASVRGAIA